jgi:D-ribose pyranase
MKKKGILHSELARIVAGIGHGDRLVICDSGFPIPHNRPVADCVLTINIPRLVDTLKVVLEELHVEEAVIANEMERISHPMYEEIQKVLHGVPIRHIPHEEFKQLTRTQENISFVRTGEATKYSNVILTAGVIF